MHHVARQQDQVAILLREHIAAALGACQGQQLIDRVGRADAGAADLLQRQLQIIGAGALPQGQISLHAQARQRCFKLVCRIRQKTFLRGHGVFQTRQQAIHRRHQGHHLLRHGAFVQRAQIVRLAGPNPRLQLVEWPRAAHQRQPHQEHRQRQDHELRQHHTLDNFSRQHRALFTGFGDLHQRIAGTRHIGLDPDGRHAHWQTPDFFIPQLDFPCRCFERVWWCRHLFFTTEQFTAQADDLVIDLVGIVRTQQLPGGLRQVELGVTVFNHHQLCQSLDVVLQGAVKRFVGDVLCHQPRQGQTGRPQQQQGREHPVQNFAKQRALLPPEDALRG